MHRAHVTVNSINKNRALTNVNIIRIMHFVIDCILGIN